jgi:cytochrome c-type biogenesis protein CcmF
VRRSLSGDSVPAALISTVTRNRRRYGGYIVHAGIALLFIAVAGSSAFQTSRDLRLEPGESASVADYELRYEEPTVAVDGDEQRLTFGAVLAVREDGERVTTLHPSRNYYSGQGDSTAGPVSGFFEGEATSEVGRRDGLGGDLWTAMQPDLASLRGPISRADEQLTTLMEGVPPNDPRAMQQVAALQGAAIRAIADRYVADPTPANFRVNVNPLVIWIWIGGAVSVLGALIGIWPSPEARRRRVADVRAARLARELSRA